MKKTVVFIMALSLVLSAALAFATLSVSTWASGTLTFKASNGVSVFCSASSTSYAAVAKHLQGDKVYGATSASTTLYSLTDTNKSAGYVLLISDVSASDAAAFGTGWSAL